MRKYKKQLSKEDQKFLTSFTASVNSSKKTSPRGFTDHSVVVNDAKSPINEDVKSKVASPSKKIKSPEQPPRRKSIRRNSEVGLGIGEVASAEAEYDFAILLRASKHEEIHYPDNTTTTSPTTSDGATSPVVIENKAYFKQHPEIAKERIIQRLQEVGLETKRLRSIEGKQTLIKVKAPQHILELGAEQLRLKKKRHIDSTWTVFRRDLIHIYADYTKKSGMKFVDSERQSIVYHLITADYGAGINDTSDYRHVVEQMFPLHKEDLGRLRHNWVSYWKVPVPFNSSTTSTAAQISRIKSTCCYRLNAHILSQPIDNVAEYFGEKVAFYFAWLELYTRWLILPSIAGCALFAVQIYDKSLDQPLAPYYAIFMALWATLFLIAWKRRASVLAYRWGVLGYEEEEIIRPDFRGDPRISTESVKRYPAWKRMLKYVITWWIVLLCTASTLTLMYFAFRQKDILEDKSVRETKAKISKEASELNELNLQTLEKWASLVDWDFWFYLLITPVLYGLFIPVLDAAYTKMAIRLNVWENHKTDSAYQTHLILKVFSFRSMHIFASLYYYAFAAGANLLKVGIQLAAFMIAGQSWNNFMETGLPFLKRKWVVYQRHRATDREIQRSSVFQLPARKNNSNTSNAAIRSSKESFKENVKLNGLIQEQCSRLEQATAAAWEESRLAPYDTFEDYAEMLIQFGYVSFFSIAFPLAPLLALLNNLFELRADAFKLCTTKQRPIARKASGIGIWFSVLQLMSVMAVITNCIHIAFTTTQIEYQVEKYFGIVLTPSDKVWVVFLAEHLILGMKIYIAFVVPTMPYEVKQKLRVENEHLKAESARAIAQNMEKEKTIRGGNLRPSDRPHENYC